MSFVERLLASSSPRPADLRSSFLYVELHQARSLKLHCTFRLEDVGGMAARYSGERRTAANFPLLDCYQHILILDRLFVLATEVAVVSSNAPICGLVCGKLPGIVNITVHCR